MGKNPGYRNGVCTYLRAWSVGLSDGCKDKAVCCFNGCENVCYNPPKRTVASVRPSPPPLAAPLPPVRSWTPPPPAAKCPRVPSLPQKMCASSRPNCWSSDTFDLDCPNSGLCCFDGCHNRCLIPAYTKTTFRPSFNYSIPLHKEVVAEAVGQKEVDNNVDSLQSINQREPTLVLHIFGPPKSKALVQFGNLPEKTSAIAAVNRRSSNRIGDNPLLPPPMAARQVFFFTRFIKIYWIVRKTKN